MLPGQLAVGLLDVAGRGGLRDAEDLVEIPHPLPCEITTRARPENTVSEAISLLEHLDDGAFLRFRGLRKQRLVDVRVELPVGLDLAEALPLERRAKLTGNKGYALGQLRLLVLLARLERTLEVVEDGQKLLHEPLVCSRDQALLVARGALPVVVEVRRYPLQVVDSFVPLGLEERNTLLEFRAGR